MSATLSAIDAQLADIRRKLTDPCFRVRTAAEHRAATRRDFLEVFTGEPQPQPPQGDPSPENQAALADLLADLRRLESDAADLRK